jgi:hypothetical protein
MDVRQMGRPVNLTATGDISTTKGHLLGFYVNSTTAGTLVLRDGGAGGTVISGTITPGIGWHQFPAESQHATLGFHATIGAALDVTFFVK